MPPATVTPRDIDLAPECSMILIAWSTGQYIARVQNKEYFWPALHCSIKAITSRKRVSSGSCHISEPDIYQSEHMQLTACFATLVPVLSTLIWCLHSVLIFIQFFCDNWLSKYQLTYIALFEVTPESSTWKHMLSTLLQIYLIFFSHIRNISYK